MLDHDPSEYGPSYSAKEVIEILGTIHPGIPKAARIIRGSVSAGVHRKGEQPAPGKGFHIYIPVLNAADSLYCFLVLLVGFLFHALDGCLRIKRINELSICLIRLRNIQLAYFGATCKFS